MTGVPQDLETAFFASARSPSIPFVINDAVAIVGGPHAGHDGAVISITAIKPDLELLVELGDGSEVRLPARHLRLLEDT
jgi:hypothetical protein